MRRTACAVLRITFAALALPSLARADGAAGTLDVTTSDNQGSVSIDGKNVGEGAYRGDVVPGPHHIVVKRLGFKPYGRDVTIEAGKVMSVTVTLDREEAAPPPPPPAETFGGLYGGFFLGPSFAPTGLGGTLDTSCSLVGAASCDTPGPVGFVVAANIGWTWDPIGVEIFAAFGLDVAQPTAHFDGVVKAGSNAALTGPARTENFTIARTGGMFALRARATIDGKRIRVAFASGPGFAVHAMGMEREATTTDGTMSDKFAAPVVTYVAPAVSFEASAAYRLTKGISAHGRPLRLARERGLERDHRRRSESLLPTVGHAAANAVVSPRRRHAVLPLALRRHAVRSLTRRFRGRRVGRGPGSTRLGRTGSAGP